MAPESGMRCLGQGMRRSGLWDLPLFKSDRKSPPNWLFFPSVSYPASQVAELRVCRHRETYTRRMVVIPWAECAVHMRACDNRVLWYTHM